MSSVSVSAKALYDCFSTLALVSPKGESPVSMVLTHTSLVFKSVSGCSFQGMVPVASEDEDSRTILWYNVCPLIPKDGDLTFDIEASLVSVRGDGVSFSFSTGYSEAVDLDLSRNQFIRLESNSYETGLQCIQAMSFDKLYGRTPPINVYGDVAVVEYPSLYLRVRTTGLPFNAAIDNEHAKVLLRFKPKEIAVNTTDSSIVLKRNGIMLELPCKLEPDESEFLSYLKGMRVVCRLEVEDFALQLSCLAKVSRKTECHLTLTESGLQVDANSGFSSVAVSVGDVTNTVLLSCRFPTEVLLAIFNTLGKGLVEILIGGDLLCLRTQTVAILTRVLY